MLYEKEAEQVKNAILQLARKPENLENLELYLSYHFAEWISSWAATPENMAAIEALEDAEDV